jgi:hypothetical protein
VVEKVVEKTVEVNKLTDDQKKALEYGERQLKAYKAKMVATIQTNAKDVWTDVELNAMDDAALEKMVKAIDTKKSEESVTDFSLNAGFQVNHSIGDEPLYPTGIEMETKK